MVVKGRRILSEIGGWRSENLWCNVVGDVIHSKQQFWCEGSWWKSVCN